MFELAEAVRSEVLGNYFELIRELNCHCLLGRESDLKLLSSTEIIIALSLKNYASNLLTQRRFSL